MNTHLNAPDGQTAETTASIEVVIADDQLIGGS